MADPSDKPKRSSLSLSLSLLKEICVRASVHIIYEEKAKRWNGNGASARGRSSANDERGRERRRRRRRRRVEKVVKMKKKTERRLMLPPPPVDMERRKRREEEATSQVREKKKKKGKVVLDEDVWVSQLEHIVERDFFPEIPKLQSKLEWLRAINSGREELIRQAQHNTARRRSGRRTPLNYNMNSCSGAEKDGGEGTKKEWNTPLREVAEEESSSFSRSEWDEAVLSRDRDRERFGSVASTPDTDFAEARTEGELEKGLPRLSLDQFCRKFNSEDNKSFEDLLERANQRIRQKRTEYGMSNQPKAGLFLCDRNCPSLEKQLIHRPVKQISHRNTAFADEAASKGREDSQPPDTYQFLKSPSPAPGARDSPFITWGEIESTPIRLDSGADLAGGPSFALKPISERETIARSLASPSPSPWIRGAKKRKKVVPGTSARQRTPRLSKAGLRLASRLRKAKAQSSYTPTPTRKSD